MRRILKIKKVSQLPIDGILLLDKPQGISSNAALQQVKRLYGARKAGHTGSLDPLATGMLPICFGEATKFSQFDLDSDKTYSATGLLGVKTSTSDAMGEVISEVQHVSVTESELSAVLAQFQGESLQTPSMYSALKHQGVPLYKYARKGIEIARPARPIQIHDLQLLQFQNNSFDIRVSCSKGTYIRNLVEDIGDILSVGAHVTQLRRLFTKGYEAHKMYSLDILQTLSPQDLLSLLLPVDTPILHLPALTLSFDEVVSLRQGKIVPRDSQGLTGECLRLYGENQYFVGLGHWLAEGQLGAKRLISFNE